MNARHSLFLLLLTGCAHCPAIIEPFEVHEPVAVACNAATVDEPQWNMANIKNSSDTRDKLKALLADYILSKGYIDELKAELIACS